MLYTKRNWAEGGKSNKTPMRSHGLQDLPCSIVLNVFLRSQAPFCGIGRYGTELRTTCSIKRRPHTISCNPEKAYAP